MGTSIRYTDFIISAIKVSKERGINTCFCLGSFGNQSDSKSAAVLAKDHINLSGWNPLIGKNDEAIGPRFPDMSGVYSIKIRESLKQMFSMITEAELSEKILVGIPDPCCLNDEERLGLLEFDNYIYTKMFIFEAIAAAYASFQVGTLLMNRHLELNNDSEKKIVQYFASLTDN